MLTVERSSLKVSQSLRISCLFISDLDCNASCLRFFLKFTVMSIMKLFSTLKLPYKYYNLKYF